MNYIEATKKPTKQDPRPYIFTAGGITSCPDWQQELRGMLECYDKATLMNPRRADFPIDDPNASYEQIKWEHEMLQKADIILFWFSRWSLNPIVLFELGSYLHKYPDIVVGVDPDYVRKQDVEVQLQLALPHLVIQTTLEGLAHAVLYRIDWRW